jgi:hypothetical protein
MPLAPVKPQALRHHGTGARRIFEDLIRKKAIMRIFIEDHGHLTTGG